MLRPCPLLRCTGLWCLAVLIRAALPAGAEARVPTCEVLLFNNPAVRAEFYNPAADQKLSMEGFPSLWVQIRDLPSTDKVAVQLAVTDAAGAALQSRSAEVTPTGATASWRVRLEAPLAKPAAAEVRVKQRDREWRYHASLPLHRLYGRIANAEGAPCPGYVVGLGYDGLMARANRNGEYELWVPETHLPAVAILDEAWGKTNVETWIHDWDPRHDVRLDTRLGQIELYELHAWRGYSGLKVDFIPLSIGLGNRLAQVVGRETFYQYYGRLSDAKPLLNREEVSVDLNGKPLHLTQFSPRVDVMPAKGEPQGRENSRPEYTLQVVDDPHNGERGHTQVLHVTVHRMHVQDGKLVEERGEGYYLGLRSYWWATGASLP